MFGDDEDLGNGNSGGVEVVCVSGIFNRKASSSFFLSSFESSTWMLASSKSHKSFPKSSMFASSTLPPLSPLRSYALIIALYVLFGAIHEFSHVAAAFALGLSDGALDEGVVVFLIRTIFGRRCVLPSLEASALEPSSVSLHVFRASIVRHFGWVVSVALIVSTWRQQWQQNQMLLENTDCKCLYMGLKVIDFEK